MFIDGRNSFSQIKTEFFNIEYIKVIRNLLVLNTMRQQLLEYFQKTLESIHGQNCVSQALIDHPISAGKCTVVAIGKAAQAMAQGAEQALAEKIISGLLITKHQHSDVAALVQQWQCHEAAHPVPDETSLEAGRQLIEFLEIHDDLPVLFLISGGTSALVEMLSDNVSLEDWQKLNEWLLASGLDITNVNMIRKVVSEIKGGKLLNHLQNRDAHALLISDVPGDHLHIIGSGLLFAEDENHFPDVNVNVPAGLKSLIDTIYQVTSVNNMQQCKLASQQIVSSNRMAMETAADFIRSAGQRVYLHNDFLTGNAQHTGEKLAAYLCDEAESGFHIWGGETTMVLPADPGRGGRNQHLALSAACVLSGNDQIVLMSAGTDGSDGPTEDAGAIVDGGTINRGQLAGLDVIECLARADSGSFLEAAGDLLYTGPTGTNVMDLVIAIKK